jgi:CheY-like chemotaxis protein
MSEQMAGLEAARILIVDDNPAIHQDFDKILGAGRTEPAAALANVESLLFGDAPAAERERARYVLEFASQGQEGVERAKPHPPPPPPDGRSRLRSLTCACLQAGTGSRPSSGSGRSTRTCRS